MNRNMIAESIPNWNSLIKLEDPFGNFMKKSLSSTDDEDADNTDNIRHNGEENDEDVANNRQSYRERRHRFLVNAMEASSIACSEHLQGLSLEQLEEIYKMSGSYDDEHYGGRGGGCRVSDGVGDLPSFLSSSSPEGRAGASSLSSLVDSFWEWMSDYYNEGEGLLWLTLFTECLNVYPKTAASFTVHQP